MFFFPKLVEEVSLIKILIICSVRKISHVRPEKKKNKYTHGYVRSSTLSCVVFTPGDINARPLPFNFPVQSCNISICDDIFTRIVNLVHERMGRILARATLR